ncbi:MAG: MFS transporter [Bilophila wadsworthia]
MSLGHLSCDINAARCPPSCPRDHRVRFRHQAAAGLMFAFSCLSSIIQPAFGYLSDKLSKPWFIPVGVLLAGGGLASIGFLHSYWAIFAAIALSGVGAALFHPEGARFANKVSGASKGTGLSLFSIGGNSGFVFGPMLAVAAIGAFGMPGTSVFGLIALVMSVILLYQISHHSGLKTTDTESATAGETEEVKNNWKEFSKLTLAIISRSVLFVGCNTFIPLYWIHNFGQSKAAGAAALTCFCTFGVISNFIGGMLSDRFGYLRIIRLSYVVLIPSIVLFGLVDNLYAAFALLLPLGFSLYAPFSSMVVLGQKYLAKNIGFASGVTLGLATSMGGIVAPLLGWIADGYGLPRAIQSMTIVAVIGTVAAFAVAQQTHGLSGENIWEGESKNFPSPPSTAFTFIESLFAAFPEAGGSGRAAAFFGIARLTAKKGSL